MYLNIIFFIIVVPPPATSSSSQPELMTLNLGHGGVTQLERVVTQRLLSLAISSIYPITLF